MIEMGAVGLLAGVPAGLLLIWLAARRSRAGLGRGRRIASFAVRALVIALLLGASALPTFTHQTTRRVCLVCAIDVSESVSEEAKSWALEQAAQRGGTLIAFAGRATRDVARESVLYRRTESKLRDEMRSSAAGAEEELVRLAGWKQEVDTWHTDLESALRAAEALVEPDGALRVIVFSDGRLDPPSGRSYPIELVRVPDSGDVAVVRVEAPIAVRYGEPFDVRVHLDSTRSCEEAVVKLTVDESTAATMRLAITPGRSVAVFRSVQPTQPLAKGTHRIFAFVDAPGDAELRNNIGVAGLTVVSQPKMLILEATKSEGERLAAILKSQQIDFNRRSVGRFDASELPEYETVILAGVGGESLNTRDLQALERYVEDGGGLWHVASEASMASLAGSRLESILPVTFTAADSKETGQPTKEKRPTPGEKTEETQTALMPRVALLLLVDKSGSMAGHPLKIVKEACIAAAESLSPGDRVGVLAFDVKASWILEFTDPSEKEYIKDRILRMAASGGTHIWEGLREAFLAIRRDAVVDKCGIKHVILLSDGDTLPADFPTLVNAMAQAGITISTVCVGSGGRFDARLMMDIADMGHGRFTYSDSFDKVPQILTAEAGAVVKGVKRRGEAKTPAPTEADAEPETSPPSTGSRALQPRAGEAHEVLSGLESDRFPLLSGKVGAQARKGAQVPILCGEADALLAIQRRGLGRTAAWTSDLSGKWSGEWLKWPKSGRLFAQLVRHLSSAANDLQLAERVRLDLDGPAQITISPGPADERLELHQTSPERKPMALRVGPGGEWLASLSVRDFVELTLRREFGNRTETLPLVLKRAYEPELAPKAALSWKPNPSPALPVERREPLTPWLLLAAILLLPLDVALRRIT